MKISRLEILNFRGIVSAVFEDLGDTIIIAGANGSGKSCVFDAIRFLKSLYGGYQNNELHQFFSEFQINPARLDRDIIKLFNDKKKNLVISAQFCLSDEEKEYISKNERKLLSEVVWRSLIPEAFNYGFYTSVQYSAQFRERQPEVDAKVDALIPALREELTSAEILTQLISDPTGKIQFKTSTLMSIIFNNYEPPHIGVIEYHGALRLYGRENVQSITLSFEANTQEQRKQSALYNYSGKYGNVKGEMAASYVRDVLAREAKSDTFDKPLSDTLKELFEHFFPNKKFLGPRPTKEGTLEFPVMVGESVHDLDELSSGEKEVLYGYLRMRNSAPKHSIILLDEPELHLNPALIRGLPQFYRNHISLALNNQMWLVSHSDALLREVVGKEGYNVYHMVASSSSGATGGQLKKLEKDAELELAVVDLIGDVAAYRPGAKAIIFEGGGDSDFDRTMVESLFPEVAKQANLISGANKVRVQALVETLKRAQDKGHIPIEFFAVTDRDLGQAKLSSTIRNHYVWNAYHIENYLLEPGFIVEVWRSIGVKKIPDAPKVMDDLRVAARSVQKAIVRQRLMDFLNGALVQAIDVGFDPSAASFSDAAVAAVERSSERFNLSVKQKLSKSKVGKELEKIEKLVEASFASGDWKRDIPGREILKMYLATEKSPIGYEYFRNMIMMKMSDADFQPEGMKQVFRKIFKP